MVYYKLRISLLEGYIKIVPAEGVLQVRLGLLRHVDDARNGRRETVADFSPRLRFCRATSDKWVLWRRAADKVAVEAAAGPEKMKSTARCSSGHSQASSWLFWWRLGDASAGDHARRGS